MHNSEQTQRTRTAIYVRLTPQEYLKIENDEKLTGISGATLLKKKYFQNKEVAVLLPESERQAWFTELNRWGNNLNQLARRVNSGLMAGWYKEFSEITTAIKDLQLLVTRVYGRR